MDRPSCEFPDIVIEAYNRLRHHRLVEITLPLRENLREGETGWEFDCIAKVPYPNPEQVPENVTLRVSIPETFPRAPVDFYPENVKAFPHQDAETGKLCLREEALAPLDASRLVCYVEWAHRMAAKTQQTVDFYNPANRMNYQTLVVNFWSFDVANKCSFYL